MAFPTTRQDHVFDSVKDIIHSDPYACEADVPSATQLLKLRRKEESRQMYYKLLPRKESADPAHKVLTNAYHQQLDIPAKGSQRQQVLVNNLVGGKYYEAKGELIKDITGPRGLGQRRDMISSLGPYSTTSSSKSMPDPPTNGALRTTQTFQTANMQYGVHTKKFAEDRATVIAEKVSSFFDSTEANKSARLHTEPKKEVYDASTECGVNAIHPTVVSNAPWQKTRGGDDISKDNRINTSAAFSATHEMPPPARNSIRTPFGQGEQNFVAPSAAIGTAQPAKLQRNAFQQPNRLGTESIPRGRAVSAATIGTHSNNFAGRQPDPASDLLNCRTGASVHHRSVGVDEGAFRPKVISHAGAHDKTVQKAAWMLNARQPPTLTKATLTEEDIHQLPSREESKGGRYTIAEEDPRYRAPIQIQSIVATPPIEDDPTQLYPPPEVQQSHYHDSHGYLAGSKHSSTGYSNPSEGPARIAAGNPSYFNTNPAYWDRVLKENERANAKPTQLRPDVSSNPIAHWRLGSQPPRASSAVGGPRYRNRPMDTVSRLF